MKNLKNEIREWIFNALLELLFKFANSHKLIKFSRSTNGDKIDYELTIRTSANASKSLVEVENNTSEYLKSLAEKNLNSLKWENEGFWPKQARERSSKINVSQEEMNRRDKDVFSVRNGYQTEEERIASHKKSYDGFASSSEEYPVKGGIIKNRSLKQKENRIELSMREDGSIVCANAKEIEQKLKDALTEARATIEYKTLPDGMNQSIITKRNGDKVVISYHGTEPLKKFIESNKDLFQEYVKEQDEKHDRQDFEKIPIPNDLSPGERERFNETYNNAMATERHIDSVLKPFPTHFRNPLEERAREIAFEEGKSIPKLSVENYEEYLSLNLDATKREALDKMIKTVKEAQREFAEVFNLPLKSKLESFPNVSEEQMSKLFGIPKDLVKDQGMKTFETSEEGMEKIPKGNVENRIDTTKRHEGFYNDTMNRLNGKKS